MTDLSFTAKQRRHKKAGLTVFCIRPEATQ